MAADDVLSGPHRQPVVRVVLGLHLLCGRRERDGRHERDACPTNSDWYAQLSSSGIGTWKQTTSYPLGAAFPACAASATDIYCVGGFDASGNGLNSVYYAPLSSSGIGQWTSTAAISD